jgi:diaminopimelate decarboxylase/aspartate kinase
MSASPSAPGSGERSSSSWVVVKFGGTSVATQANWQNIVAVVRQRLGTGARVLVVHSAISGITDLLERLLADALRGDTESPLGAIEKRHRSLAADLGVSVTPALEQQFRELKEIAIGISLIGEVSDRTRARVLASGELMATELGANYLAAQGIAATWADARTFLQAESRGANAKASVLSASCEFAPDAALERRLDALTPVVVTQGFIASDDEGHTVLLGRGGSDTSAAYLAAKLRARQLEIWTDVPGMFSANPKSTPSARLLHALHYDEAQEIASSGAKVLHPRCILPARQYQIPLYVYATQMPTMRGTVLTSTSGEGSAQVKAVCTKKGITLVSMDSPGMWHEVGFLADAFQIFKQHGMSVDLVSTSETNVTVSLDSAANTLDAQMVADLLADLSRLCRAEAIGPCASVSLVGRNIRGILHKLGPAFELFEEQKIYLVSQSANDLNFTFVVDESQGDRLVNQLHDLLIQPAPNDPVLGPTWEQLFAKPAAAVAARAHPWWHTRRQELLALMRERDAAYVYDLKTVHAAAQTLRSLDSVDRVLYALKANPHRDILRVVNDAGLGFECVSIGEVEHVLQTLPGIDRRRVLFTPNFAPRTEYERGLALGIHVTIDSRYAIDTWPALFEGREILLRIDTGVGRGHHQHVRTAGADAKFGIPVEEVAAVRELIGTCGARVVGVHAHAGSGVFDPNNWVQVGGVLGAVAAQFTDCRIVDIGGGLGVPDRLDAPPLDLTAMRRALAQVKANLGGRELWLEPGRFLVAQAGVLLAKVTQVKCKGDTRFIGLATGMNSLLRPALYGAHHDVFNLSRLDEPANEQAHVVGPICESADFIGHDRMLPAAAEGDVMLVATAGAYGRGMGSHYNLRAPAEELTL